MDGGRRRFLRASLAGLLAGGCLAGCRRDGEVARPELDGEDRPPAPPRDERPNIVLVMADDLGLDGIGAYGSESHQTPRIDALARQGVRFENCYATPLCTPSRVELLTGRYPFRTGYTENLSMVPKKRAAAHERMLVPEAGVFPVALRAAGYRTAVAGKWQLCHLEERPGHPRELGFDHASLWRWTANGRLTERYWNAAIWQNGRLLRPRPDRYGPDHFCEFLTRFVRRDARRPYFAFFPMVLPHPPYEPTPDQCARDNLGLGARLADVRNHVAMVAYLDSLVGRLWDAVSEAGQAARTLMIFTSDNGTPRHVRSRFRGRARTGGKDSMSEYGMRVPLIVSGGPVAAPGRVCDGLVDFTDFAVTFAELAGARLGFEPDGVSFAPVLHDVARAPRTHAFSQLGDATCIRDARWKLYSDGRLFDLVDDPWEERDRGDDPAVEDVRRSLRLAMDELTESV